MKNKDLKRRIIEISYPRKQSHLGSCLTAVDIIDDIYKKKALEDKFVLSQGHAGLALYVVLERYGNTNAEYLFDKHGVHPNRDIEAGIWVSSGSLGHGIGIAVGMALADRSRNIYCLISDGECAEGSVWEALRIIKEQKLDNLKVYLNYNGYSAYQESNPFALVRQIDFPAIVRHTGSDILMPILKEPQEAHYKVMNEEDYKKMMEVLK